MALGWSDLAGRFYDSGMSDRTRNLPRRSCLSVPASSEKMLGKAPGLPADMVFLDLEDAVAPLEKESARAKAVDAIKNQDWGEKVLCVRVNAWDTKWTYGDVIEVVGNAGERLDEIMLPKVQQAAEVIAMDLLLTQVEINAGLPIGHIGIEAQIETARGLINVNEICSSSKRLETVILGPVDFSASMEMPSLAGGLQIPEYPGDYFHYVFMKILMAGRANGLQVIDGPYVKVRDPEGFRDYCTRTEVLGYDGKWALHPDQIPILNEVFSPSQEQFDKAWDVLEAYKSATEGDRKGAVMFGDEMIDEASRKVAVKLVAKGERAGMKRSAA
jgi:citrate lyase subunit beta / citryl-CoA lyase